MELVKTQVDDQVRKQVWNRVWDEVSGDVWDKVCVHSSYHVYGCVFDKVCNLVKQQVANNGIS